MIKYLKNKRFAFSLAQILILALVSVNLLLQAWFVGERLAQNIQPAQVEYYAPVMKQPKLVPI